MKILEFDKENFKIKAQGFGETFNLDKHPQVIINRFFLLNKLLI